MTGSVNGTGGQASLDAASVRARITTFRDRYASGEFDDANIASQLAASQNSLAASNVIHHAAITTPGGADGANAAPAANVFDASSGLIRDEATVQRLLVEQAEARFQNVDAALRHDFPLAELLPSAETGWDPAAFVPTTPADAEAFAQRVVVDATRAASRLEVLVATRDAAAIVARTTGDAGAAAKVTELGKLIDGQLAYVDKLAALVDSSSRGAVTEAGAATLKAARQGNAEAADVAKVGAAAKGTGASDQVVERLVGAAAIARERVSGREGADRRLRKITAEVATFTFEHRDDLAGARRREARAIEERRVEERRVEEQQDREYRDQQDAIVRYEAEQWEHVRGVVLRAEQRSEDAHVDLLRSIDERRGRDIGPRQVSFEQWMRGQALDRTFA